MSAHWKCECADSYPWPIHAGMTGWCWWRMPAHLHRLEGAQTEWKAAWWSVPVLLYTLFCLFYALFVLAEQDCGPCKYVLRTAFLCKPILCVTTRLWNIGVAAIGVESAQTVTIILDYFCNFTHYSTTNYSYNSKMFINYSNDCKAKMAIWDGIHCRNRGCCASWRHIRHDRKSV